MPDCFENLSFMKDLFGAGITGIDELKSKNKETHFSNSRPGYSRINISLSFSFNHLLTKTPRQFNRYP